MIICARCGKELEYAFSHQGLFYGSECIKVITGKVIPRSDLSKQVAQTTWKTVGKYRYFLAKSGKWKPLFMSKYLHWERSNDIIYVPKTFYNQ